MQSSRGCATPTIFRTSQFCWQRSLRKIGGATRFNWFAESPVLPGDKRSLGHFTMPLI